METQLDETPTAPADSSPLGPPESRYERDTLETFCFWKAKEAEAQQMLKELGPEVQEILQRQFEATGKKSAQTGWGSLELCERSTADIPSTEEWLARGAEYGLPDAQRDQMGADIAAIHLGEERAKHWKAWFKKHVAAKVTRFVKFTAFR